MGTKSIEKNTWFYINKLKLPNRNIFFLIEESNYGINMVEGPF